MDYKERKKYTAIRAMDNEQLKKYMSGILADGVLVGMDLYEQALKDHPKIFKPAIAQVKESVSQKLIDILNGDAPVPVVDNTVDSGDNADG